MKRLIYTAAALVLATGVVLAAPEALKNLLTNPNNPESWHLELNEDGKATMNPDADGVLFDVTAVGSEYWHVQAYITGIAVREGREYTFTYKAKADPARAVRAVSCIHEDDWHAIGLDEDMDIATEWKEYTHTFTAQDIAKNNNNRIGFLLGTDKGKVWIKDASLTEKPPATTHPATAPIP